MAQRTYSGSDLCKRIELLVKTRVSDGGGGVTETYGSASPPIVLWASIMPQGARESWYAEQLSSAERTIVVIRYRAGVTQSMRVAYNGRTFEITGVVDIGEEHRWLELACEERQSG